MRRYSQVKRTIRLAVEELEQRSLLSGMGPSRSLLAGAALSTHAATVSGALPGLSMITSASPTFNSANFDPEQQITNPYVRFLPSTTFMYTGIKDGQPMTDVITVTFQTKMIVGVTTTVVTDVAFVNGQLAEQTTDWYAQDKQGNVWYFGENTAEYQNGKVVSTEGTWRAGVKRAQPGIVMEANPIVGDVYQQEFAPNVAQDMAAVQSLNAKVTVTAGTFKNCLQTQETSPLEPGFVENKFYASGVGFLESLTVQGGNESLQLVSVTQNGNGAIQLKHDGGF